MKKKDLEAIKALSVEDLETRGTERRDLCSSFPACDQSAR